MPGHVLSSSAESCMPLFYHLTPAHYLDDARGGDGCGISYLAKHTVIACVPPGKSHPLQSIMADDALLHTNRVEFATQHEPDSWGLGASND